MYMLLYLYFLILLLGTVAQMSDVTHRPLVLTASHFSSQARLTPALYVVILQSVYTNRVLYNDDYN